MLPTIVKPHRGKAAVWYLTKRNFDAYLRGDNEEDGGLHDVQTFAFVHDIKNNPQWYPADMVRAAESVA